jgi:hypothetical protein
MHSSTDEITPEKKSSSGSLAETARRWNRKLHYYLGLLTLLFVWLFSFTGLLLNHQWKFAEFWDSRQQSTSELDIIAPAPGSDLDQARDILRQLALRGEIEWTATRGDANRFDFRVSRPGHICEVQTDLARNRATVKRIDLNVWGVMRILHSFTGVRMDDNRNGRDWFLTSVWALAMDAVAAALILMVLSSLYMWFELRTKRLWGALALSAGLLSCALFCVGLRWLC